MMADMDWRLHWLEAEAELTPWREAIGAEIQAASAAFAEIVRTPPIDVLIERVPGEVIPEVGIVGRAFRARLLKLTVDPDNPHFASSLASGGLRQTVAHEVHHCLRMTGPGYGRTLGDALVSEGLAGQFTRRLFGNPPEPWECSVDRETLRSHLPKDIELTAARYDHNSWFFGVGGHRPRWLGYTLGYVIVGEWLEKFGEPGGDAWISVPASVVLGASSIPGAGHPEIRWTG